MPNTWKLESTAICYAANEQIRSRRYLEIGERADSKSDLAVLQNLYKLIILNAMDAMINSLHIQKIKCLSDVIWTCLFTCITRAARKSCTKQIIERVNRSLCKCTHVIAIFKKQRESTSMSCWETLRCQACFLLTLSHHACSSILHQTNFAFTEFDCYSKKQELVAFTGSQFLLETAYLPIQYIVFVGCWHYCERQN